MDRTKRVAEPRNDYFVITKLVPRIRPIRWTWEIRHRSTLQIRRGSISLGIKYGGEEYATAQDAKLAGKTALKDLLRNLADLG